MKSPQVFAHRGARGVAPENTIAAFEKALEMGVDGIELDVQCSSDGQLVVIHDFEVDQLTDGQGVVQELSMDALRQLDAGSHFDASFKGECIPLLADVLDLVGDRCMLNIEIKSRAPNGGIEVEQVIEALQQRNLRDQVIVSSFNMPTLIKLRWIAPNVQIGLLYSEPLPDYLRQAWLSPIIDPQALHPHYSLIDEVYMEHVKIGGYLVNTWTVNETTDAQRLAELGVDVIISDVPDQIMAILR